MSCKVFKRSVVSCWSCAHYVEVLQNQQQGLVILAFSGIYRHRILINVMALHITIVVPCHIVILAV
jgi:hypothetical protein